jgi:folate-dependent phosphoribosylglycinamide formyltransferase PurN
MPHPDASLLDGPADTRRVAVAVSGGGRSLANFLDWQRRGDVAYEIAAVVTNKPTCGGVAIAEAAKLPVFKDSFAATTQGTTDTATRLYAWLHEHRIGWVALAGFLKPWPLSPAWTGRVVNIHPALLPAFGGKGMYGDHVHRAVLASKLEVTGATVHLVTERYDEGAILAQVQVPVLAGDDAAALAARVFQGECRLYPQVLSRLVTGGKGLPLTGGIPWLLSEGEGGSA